MRSSEGRSSMTVAADVADGRAAAEPGAARAPLVTAAVVVLLLLRLTALRWAVGWLLGPRAAWPTALLPIRRRTLHWVATATLASTGVLRWTIRHGTHRMVAPRGLPAV